MNTFPLEILSPTDTLFSGEAVMLTLRGAAGDLAVMAGHIPFITTVKPCQCKVETEDSVRIGTTEGGVLSVTKDGTTFLSHGFKWL